MSTSLGFDVVKSAEETVTKTLKLKKGETGAIDVRMRYKKYKGTLQRKYRDDFGHESWVTQKNCVRKKL